MVPYLDLAERPPPQSAYSEVVDEEPKGYWFQELGPDHKPTGLWLKLYPGVVSPEKNLPYVYIVREVRTLPFKEGDRAEWLARITHGVNTLADDPKPWVLGDVYWRAAIPPKQGSLTAMSSPTRLLESGTLLQRDGDLIVTLKKPPPQTSWSPGVDGEPAGYWLQEIINGKISGLWLILLPIRGHPLKFGIREVRTLPFKNTTVEALYRTGDGIRAIKWGTLP